MKIRNSIFLIGLLVFLLISIRFYENQLFYDPLLRFFKSSGYLQNQIPDFNPYQLILNTIFRYTLNSFISVAIIAIAFQDRNIIKFSAVLYLLLLILIGSIFSYLIFTIENQHYLVLFYVRRFLIHPIFLLVLFPAFYYYRLKQRNNNQD